MALRATIGHGTFFCRAHRRKFMRSSHFWHQWPAVDFRIRSRSASGCSSTRIVALLVLGVAGMAMSRKFSGATAWRQSYSRNRSMHARTFNSISLRESCGVENVTVCASSWLVRTQILHSAALEHWHWLGQPPSRPRNISYHPSHETSCGRQDFIKVAAASVKRKICGQRNRQLRE